MKIMKKPSILLVLVSLFAVGGLINTALASSSLCAYGALGHYIGTVQFTNTLINPKHDHAGAGTITLTSGSSTVSIPYAEELQKDGSPASYPPSYKIGEITGKISFLPTKGVNQMEVSDSYYFYTPASSSHEQAVFSLGNCS